MDYKTGWFKLTPPIDPKNTEEMGSQKQLWVTFSPPQHKQVIALEGHPSNIKLMLHDLQPQFFTQFCFVQSLCHVNMPEGMEEQAFWHWQEFALFWA